ncbi:RND transporter [Rickettsia parkeri]|nr:RND transporter [Rickettsia parkeri]
MSSIVSSLRGKTVSVDETISGICYYFIRLPHSLRLFTMTKKLIHTGIT